jgi:hypothetical protein
MTILVVTYFFLSGLAGLMYEIQRTRMIVKIIGAALLAVSIKHAGLFFVWRQPSRI